MADATSIDPAEMLAESRPLPQADWRARSVRGPLRRDLRSPLRPRESRRRGPDHPVVPDATHLSSQLLLFYTAMTRSANAILDEQSANMADRLPQLAQLRYRLFDL